MNFMVFDNEPGAQQLANDLHKLFGGTRVESDAVGVGPAARAWLLANGPPTTESYTSVLTIDGQYKVICKNDVVSALAEDNSSQQPTLSTNERARVADAIVSRTTVGKGK